MTGADARWEHWRDVRDEYRTLKAYQRIVLWIALPCLLLLAYGLIVTLSGWIETAVGWL